MSKKVAVALSGGVDSTMSALYLKELGYDVAGVHFIIHSLEEINQQNRHFVEQVASFLDIPYEVIDLRDEFKRGVFDYFIKSYENAETPNPCALCNRVIKFGSVYESIKERGVELLATGHYARCDGEFIYRGRDRKKDQSYFMFGVKKEVLKDLIFPLGERFKEEIKKEALKIPLLKEIASKKESSEICFVPQSYIDVLRSRTNPDMVGEVVDEYGAKVGTHKGYMHYTIGKRKGFDVPLSHDKLYVKEIDATKNQIVVGKKEGLYRKEVEVEVVNLFEEIDTKECEVKIRYNTDPAAAKVILKDSKATISFKDEVFGVAKGQMAVFYDGDRLLGGGIIV